MFRERDPDGAFDLVVDGDCLWLPNSPPSRIEIDGIEIPTGGRVRLAQGQHAAEFPDGKSSGMLVLAMDGPPRLPLARFYRKF